MPEELLDRPEVGASLEQMRGESVAEPVRVPNEPAHGAGVQPSPAGGEEERVGRATRERWPGRAEVQRNVVRRFLPEGTTRSLPPLPWT